ncbi:MAG TPA: glycosyltransferase family 39 protein [Desulfobacterales bacterium]|nr:glycosyltransferase family 39 protein [Desulfobacterales bacterium]
MNSIQGQAFSRLYWILLGLGIAVYLFFSLTLIQTYPWERIGSTYLLPPYELIHTGQLRLEYQLYYSSTDRLLANPPLYYLVLAGLIKILGAGIVQVRLLAILVNLAIMLTVYILVKSTFSRQAAALSVFLLAISDAFFSYSFYARPTQLSTAFFILSLLFAVIAQKRPRESYAVSFFSGLLMGSAVLSHPFIITYGLILPITFFCFSPDRKNWRPLLRHILSATVGLFLPICIYIAWLGGDLPEWWHVQKILAGSDATNNRDLSASFGIWEFLKSKFFHWNYDFDYKPCKLLAVHRQHVWLGFPWGWAFAVGGAYCIVWGILKRTNGGRHSRPAHWWIAISVILAVFMPGILFPRGGTEYLLPVHIIFMMAFGVFLCDAISHEWSVWASRISQVFGIFVILMILSLRLYYNINVFNTVTNVPGYEHYMAELRENIPRNSFKSVVGPHLIAAGFIGYQFFDFYSLYDFYAFKDRARFRRGWKTDHPAKVEFPIAFCERLLKNRDLLVSNANSVKQRTKAVMDFIATSGFYQQVAQVESKYYGLSRAYLPATQHWVPIDTQVTPEGTLLIHFQQKEPRRLNAVFVRYQRPRSSLPEVWLSPDGRAFYQAEVKKGEVLAGERGLACEHGLFWAPGGLPKVSIIRLSGVGIPEFVAVCALPCPEEGRQPRAGLAANIQNISGAKKNFFPTRRTP